MGRRGDRPDPLYFVPIAEEETEAVLGLLLDETPYQEWAPQNVVDYVREGQRAILESLREEDLFQPWQRRLFRVAKRLHEHRMPVRRQLFRARLQDDEPRLVWLPAFMPELLRETRSPIDRHALIVTAWSALQHPAVPCFAGLYARKVRAAAAKRVLLAKLGAAVARIYGDPNLSARDCLIAAQALLDEAKAEALDRPRVWQLPRRQRPGEVRDRDPRPPRPEPPPRPSATPVRRTVAVGGRQLQGRTAYRRAG